MNGRIACPFRRTFRKGDQFDTKCNQISIRQAPGQKFVTCPGGPLRMNSIQQNNHKGHTVILFHLIHCWLYPIQQKWSSTNFWNDKAVYRSDDHHKATMGDQRQVNKKTRRHFPRANRTAGMFDFRVVCSFWFLQPQITCVLFTLNKSHDLDYSKKFKPYGSRSIILQLSFSKCWNSTSRIIK